MTQAQDYLAQYQAAYQNRQLARRASRSCRRASSARRSARTRSSRPRRSAADAAVQDLQQRTQLAYNGAVSSYEQVTKLSPNDSNAWFQLAQAAQTGRGHTTAVAAYKRYLKLNPDSTSRGQIQAADQAALAGTRRARPKKKK